MMGDFNSVEDLVDRCPIRKDEKEAEEAIKGLVKKLKLKDVWREMHKEEKGYTFIQQVTKSTVRINRIYMTKGLAKLTYESMIELTYRISDHCIVTAKIMTDKLPYCGVGMWKLKKEIVNNKSLRNRLKKSCKNTKEGMTDKRTGNRRKRLMEAKRWRKCYGCNTKSTPVLL